MSSEGDVSISPSTEKYRWQWKEKELQQKISDLSTVNKKMEEENEHLQNSLSRMEDAEVKLSRINDEMTKQRDEILISLYNSKIVTKTMEMEIYDLKGKIHQLNSQNSGLKTHIEEQDREVEKITAELERVNALLAMAENSRILIKEEIAGQNKIILDLQGRCQKAKVTKSLLEKSETAMKERDKVENSLRNEILELRKKLKAAEDWVVVFKKKVAKEQMKKKEVQCPNCSSLELKPKENVSDLGALGERVRELQLKNESLMADNSKLKRTLSSEGSPALVKETNFIKLIDSKKDSCEEIGKMVNRMKNITLRNLKSPSDSKENT